jgi:hypothetical protein
MSTILPTTATLPSLATAGSSVGLIAVAELQLTGNRPWYSSVTTDSKRQGSPSSDSGTPALAHVTK